MNNALINTLLNMMDNGPAKLLGRLMQAQAQVERAADQPLPVEVEVAIYDLSAQMASVRKQIVPLLNLDPQEWVSLALAAEDE